MSPEENPYAPPREGAAAHLTAAPQAGWHIIGGILHVRDGVTLPRICLQGFPPDLPGRWKRQPLFVSSSWWQWLPALPMVGWMIWQYRSPDTSIPPLHLALALFLASLPTWLFAKRGHFHTHISAAATRRYLIRGVCGLLIGLTAAAVITWLLHQIWKPAPHRIDPLRSMLPAAIGGGAAAFAFRQRIRASRYDDGWFALTDVHPDAIAALIQIQHGEPMPTAPNPPRDTGHTRIIVTPE